MKKKKEDLLIIIIIKKKIIIKWIIKYYLEGIIHKIFYYSSK